MPRIARIAVEAVPYHLTQCGNAKQKIFFADADYRMYLDLLRRYSTAHGLAVWAYCLMPNHVHLIVVPRQETSMAKTLGRTHAEYARYFNLNQRSCGHVGQARYYSCPLAGAHLWRAMAYVEQNPYLPLVECGQPSRRPRSSPHRGPNLLAPGVHPRTLESSSAHQYRRRAASRANPRRNPARTPAGQPSFPTTARNPYQPPPLPETNEGQYPQSPYSRAPTQF